jgi:hypothetical protein
VTGPTVIDWTPKAAASATKTMLSMAVGAKADMWRLLVTIVEEAIAAIRVSFPRRFIPWRSWFFFNLQGQSRIVSDAHLVNCV